MNIDKAKELLNLCDRYEDLYNGYTNVHWAFGNIGTAMMLKTTSVYHSTLKHANTLVIWALRDQPGTETVSLAVFEKDDLSKLECCGTLVEKTWLMFRATAKLRCIHWAKSEFKLGKCHGCGLEQKIGNAPDYDNPEKELWLCLACVKQL